MSFIRGNLTVTASDYWKSCSHAEATSLDSKDEALGSLGGAAAGLSHELDRIEHDILPVALALDAMRVESALLRDGGRIGGNTSMQAPVSPEAGQVPDRRNYRRAHRRTGGSWDRGNGRRTRREHHRHGNRGHDRLRRRLDRRGNRWDKARRESRRSSDSPRLTNANPKNRSAVISGGGSFGADISRTFTSK